MSLGITLPPLTTFTGLPASFLGGPVAFEGGLNQLLFGTSLQQVPINFGNYLPFFPPSVGGTSFTTPGSFGGVGVPLISPFQNMGNGQFASPFCNFGVGPGSFSGGFGGFIPFGGFSGFGVPLGTQPVQGFNQFGQFNNPFGGFGGIAVQQPQFGGGFGGVAQFQQPVNTLGAFQQSPQFFAGFGGTFNPFSGMGAGFLV